MESQRGSHAEHRELAGRKARCGGRPAGFDDPRRSGRIDRGTWWHSGPHRDPASDDRDRGSRRLAAFGRWAADAHLAQGAGTGQAGLRYSHPSRGGIAGPIAVSQRADPAALDAARAGATRGCLDRAADRVAASRTDQAGGHRGRDPLFRLLPGGGGQESLRLDALGRELGPIAAEPAANAVLAGRHRVAACTVDDVGAWLAVGCAARPRATGRTERTNAVRLFGGLGRSFARFASLGARGAHAG